MGRLFWNPCARGWCSQIDLQSTEEGFRHAVAHLLCGEEHWMHSWLPQSRLFQWSDVAPEPPKLGGWGVRSDQKCKGTASQVWIKLAMPCLCNSRCTFELMLEGGMCLAKRRGWAFNKIDLKVSLWSHKAISSYNAMGFVQQARRTKRQRSALANWITMSKEIWINFLLTW